MDALIAAAIHDAKNGINALDTWLAEAKRNIAAGPASAALDHATQASAQVNAQLVELLTLYRENAGTLRLVIADNDLADFCAELLRDTPPPPGSTLQLELELEAATRIAVWAFDAYQVKLVLADALRNAYRHAATRIRFALDSANGGGIQFTVENDGASFPETVLAGQTPAMRAGGSGLGLTFAKLIARRHTTPDGRHGSIELNNIIATASSSPASKIEPIGARFSLILP